MEDFVRELGVSLAAYGKSEQHRPVRQMLGLGGGFQLHGLLAFLRSRKVCLIAAERRRRRETGALNRRFANLSFYLPAAIFRATKYGTGSLPRALSTVPPAVKT